jgi:hypothetical protein
LRLAYSFLEANGLSGEAEKIRVSKEQLGSYTTTLRRAKVVSLLKKKNLLNKFIEEHWPNGAIPEGKQHIEFLLKTYEKYEKTGATAVGQEEEEDEAPEKDSFAYEEDLRDYLAQTLTILEDGLVLWPVGPDADAVEFPLNGRRIDILAKDKSGIPVVVELKVSRGHEKIIGQTLYYREKVKELFAVDKVRIFIVGREISLELKTAVKGLTDVSLFEYSLSVTVKRL